MTDVNISVKELGTRKHDGSERSRSKWFVEDWRTSEAIQSASSQSNERPAKQPPGDRAADQEPPRQADTCWRQPDPATTDRPTMEKMETTVHLTTLTIRGRWRKTCQEPSVGDIVLVQEPGTAWVKRLIETIIVIHPSETVQSDR
ncbi:hypothetical protein T10_1985 [Trichinella papuae]|uniref:DUF5641 domain-containing protein n=1 Tax=Trichinella papuae TaxID=268474 RepID=A0A0V1M155_9BILA|nr:hypothetical protein T10_9395 [Trichinella papuae]KRZ65612.1 hypothetical protein T10_11808 [Trichinella papuae]KRZ65613.1 hypothetical protein T10_1985 [Trichinella papuae]